MTTSGKARGSLSRTRLRAQSLLCRMKRASLGMVNRAITPDRAEIGRISESLVRILLLQHSAEFGLFGFFHLLSLGKCGLTAFYVALLAQ